MIGVVSIRLQTSLTIVCIALTIAACKKPPAPEPTLVEIGEDIFLNETARYAHVFLPGATFLEKDGTFINSERRIGLASQTESGNE